MHLKKVTGADKLQWSKRGKTKGRVGWGKGIRWFYSRFHRLQN